MFSVHQINVNMSSNTCVVLKCLFPKYKMTYSEKKSKAYVSKTCIVTLLIQCFFLGYEACRKRTVPTDLCGSQAGLRGSDIF